ncbi:hypothetical protein [Bradyrhizobium japonicum]|uniref:hypothetical protein n=1 Tax=Bradyrhizobium japonicum TaxID=375 RepID=UPI002714C63B|nr:hypothetical protein [Bradyrhizobium japonicum]WLB54839.1 hypothetical protein QIH94_02275 [Bradyrhizobium japonicum]WLB63286.1 hypothetical protein QIH96_43610 [Bradyrhizobium japonicum]
MKHYDVSEKTRAGTYIRARVGENFRIRLPEVQGRIIEPSLGRHTIVEHTCRTEGDGSVEFDMVARREGCELIEFPLIDVDWDGSSDPDPRKAEDYARILVVVHKGRAA